MPPSDVRRRLGGNIPAANPSGSTPFFTVSSPREAILALATPEANGRVDLP